MVFANILVAYDGSDHAKAALEMARQFALEGEDVRLRLLTVVFPADVDPGMYYDGTMGPDVESLELDQEMDKAAQTRALDELHEAAATLEGIPADRIACDVELAPAAAETIAAFAKEHGCDLIVMGSRGQGGVKGYLGSVSYAVTKESPVTVLIAKDGARQ